MEKSDVSATSTKHQRILETVREEIESGAFRPGDRLPSDAELVERFRASRPTIAKALQELERSGMVRRRPGSGTYVNPPTEESRIFGLLIPGLGETEIFEPICWAMARRAQELSHSLLWGASPSETIGDADRCADGALQACRQFVENRASGVFFAPLVVADHSGDINREIAETLQKADIPIVLLDRDIDRYPERSPFDLVGVDNRRAGFAMAKHLIEQGAQSLLFVAHRYAINTTEARIAGFLEALVACGVDFDPARIHRCDPGDREYIRQALETHQADGVVCGNDVAAAELIHALDAIGKQVPRDVLVGGIDDVKYAQLLRPPLTSVQQPCEAIGRAAIRAMLDRIEAPQEPPREILLHGRLVVRTSSQRSAATT